MPGTGKIHGRLSAPSHPGLSGADKARRGLVMGALIGAMTLMPAISPLHAAVPGTPSYFSETGCCAHSK